MAYDPQFAYIPEPTALSLLGSRASGRLEPFAAFTRLISAISSLHGSPAAHSPPLPLRSLAVCTP